jgi:hypothetical protein
VGQEQQHQPTGQTVQTRYLVLLRLLVVVVVVLKSIMGRLEAQAEEAQAALLKLAVLELQGKVTLEETVLAQSLVLTPSVLVAVAAQVLLVLLEQRLVVTVAQDFAPQ